MFKLKQLFDHIKIKINMYLTKKKYCPHGYKFPRNNIFPNKKIIVRKKKLLKNKCIFAKILNYMQS